MTDLDDLLNDDDENIEEGTLNEEEDGLDGLFDGDESGVEDDDDIEAPPPIPAKTSKKKASKKKASKKKAAKKAEPEEDDGLEGLFGDDEKEKPRKKKASKKKAAKKTSVQKSSTEPEQPRKKKASKKKATRKPRVSSDPLASLKDELAAIADDSEGKAQLTQLKADLRAAKLLSTKLEKFAKRATAISEGQKALVEKLEAKLASMTGGE